MKPYLDVVLSLSSDHSVDTIQPLFTAFYLEKIGDSTSSRTIDETKKDCIAPPSLPFAPLPDIADIATDNAELTFFEALKYLRTIRTLPDDGDEDTAFWPPLASEQDDDDNEW